jgi:hypothetical protein
MARTVKMGGLDEDEDAVWVSDTSAVDVVGAVVPVAIVVPL